MKILIYKNIENKKNSKIKNVLEKPTLRIIFKEWKFPCQTSGYLLAHGSYCDKVT